MWHLITHRTCTMFPEECLTVRTEASKFPIMQTHESEFDHCGAWDVCRNQCLLAMWFLRLAYTSWQPFRCQWSTADKSWQIMMVDCKTCKLSPWQWLFWNPHPALWVSMEVWLEVSIIPVFSIRSVVGLDAMTITWDMSITAVPECQCVKSGNCCAMQTYKWLRHKWPANSMLGSCQQRSFDSKAWLVLFEMVLHAWGASNTIPVESCQKT